jgi:UDP-2-acetamido-3-amino-2,3-dideoxy-glucuronate N-acetyltransferase
MTKVAANGEALIAFTSDSATISESASIASSAKIWEYSQIRENVIIGENTIVGSYVYIDSNVQIGRNCKIQNRALLYHPAKIHDGVFIGPGVILTNDHNPRAIQENETLKSEDDWEKEGVVIEKGASVGAGAICIAPVLIGSWALVGAGAVVTKNVPPFAIVLGNPAKQIGWVGRHGFQLLKISEDIYECPKTLVRYKALNGELEELETE